MKFFRLLGASRRPALRGRVHRVSIIAGGEVSIVLRFGIDEPDARQLNQGCLAAVDRLTENTSQDKTK